MTTSNPSAEALVFDDDALVQHLNKHKIPYIVQKSGLIDIDIDRTSSFFPIEIPAEYQTVNCQNLRTAPTIDAKHITDFEANNLVTVTGNFDVRHTQNVSANALETIQGSFHAQAAKTIAMKNLRDAGHLNIHTVRKFAANKLERVNGHMIAKEAKSVSLKSLQYVSQFIQAPAAEIFAANKLEIVESFLDIKSAKQPEINKLKKSYGVFVTPELAGTENDTFIFSDQIGPEATIAIFNKNTHLAQMGWRNWTSIEPNTSDNLHDMVTRRYPQDAGLYHAFFDHCRNSIS